MISECDTLQQLLNEDEFAPELCAMAQSGMELLEGVEQTIVCAIGPAGILLRARISTGDVVETTVSFPEVANSVDQLRNNVMSAIDSVAA